MKSRGVLFAIVGLLISGATFAMMDPGMYCDATNYNMVCTDVGFTALPAPTPIDTGEVCNDIGYIDINSITPAEINTGSVCSDAGYILPDDIVYPILTMPNGQTIELSGQDYLIMGDFTGYWTQTGTNMELLMYETLGSGTIQQFFEINYQEIENGVIRGIAIGGSMLLILIVILYLLRGLFVKFRK